MAQGYSPFDPRMALAQSLFQQPIDNRTVGSALGGLGSKLIGAMLLRRASDQRADALNKAFAAGNPWTPPDNVYRRSDMAPDIAGSGFLKPNRSAQPVVPAGAPAPGTGGLGAMVSSLASSGVPDLQGLGMQMKVSQMQGAQNFAQQIALEREKAKIRAGSPLTEPAKALTDIGLLKREFGLTDDHPTIKTLRATASGDKVLSGKDAFDRADKLRDEFSKNSGDFIDVRDAYRRVKAAAEDPSAAGDLALIFNYMKMLDPGSVIRESEFATAETAAGVPDRIRNIYNKILRGERLGVQQRQDFVDRANRLINTQEESHKLLISEYARLAANAGVSSEDVIVDFVGGLLSRRGDDSALLTKQQKDARTKYGVQDLTDEQILQGSLQAIVDGAPESAVRQRLLEMGIK